MSHEDRNLWSRVVRGATPLSRSGRMSPPKPGPTEPAMPSSEPVAVPSFLIGKKAQQSAVASGKALTVNQKKPPRMDARAFGRMKRGKLAPEARIDLHGMTAAVAHGVLTSFILRARADGKRLVLVITGKGRISTADGSGGILRREVPHWLAMPPLSHAVLQVEVAHRKHGGEGAYYVYLRRGE